MSLDADDVRELALELPETEVRPHHGFPSFRVGGKIYATLPDEETCNVMLDPDAAAAVVASDPRVALLHWGAKVAGVRVALPAAEHAQLAALLEAAWRRRAPKRLL